MLRNYLKLGLRNMIKQKESSIINVLGLAVGLASAILILMWIQHEVSYDKFHQRSNRLYRITSHLDQMDAAISPAPLSPALVKELPEVESAVRTSLPYTHLITSDDQSFEEDRILYVDSTFLEVFSFPLLKGDMQTALARPESILLSESSAEKYFGQEDPIGKTLRIDQETDLTVTAVLAELPSTTHLQFDMLIPLDFLARTNRDLKENIWDNFDFYGYLSLHQSIPAGGQDIENLQNKIDAFYRSKVDGFVVNFRLQPITDIHLHPDYMGDVAGLGNIQSVYILSIAVLLILLIAAINFMNLSTAKATRRAREVGFRKVVGASRRQLIAQFLTESCLIALASFFIALAFVYLLLPSFATLTGVDYFGSLTDGWLLFGFFALAISIGLLAGSYPAFYLSAFEPQRVFSLQRQSKGGHTFFRNGLVMVQFFFSIILISGTIVIYKQQQFIKHQDLGFDKENLIYVELNKELAENIEGYRNQLRENPFTEKHAFSSSLPTNLLSGTVGLDWEGKDPEKQVLFANIAIDEGFVEVFDMEMKNGRTFSQELETDQGSYIVNETALGIMEMNADEAVGKSFNLWGNEGHIIGVVSDFHYKPIRQPIEPMVMRYEKDGKFVVIRAGQGSTEQTIAFLEKLGRSVAPSYPFEFGFVDQDLDNLYQSEQRLGSLVQIFALIAIFVSCLGLYGLSAFLANQRRKEVGVRKILGATVSGMVIQLSREFTKPIWISMLIAAPVAYFLISKWLENFAYHINLSWWVILASCMLALVIAVATTSIETLRVARSNPIDVIHKE